MQVKFLSKKFEDGEEAFVTDDGSSVKILLSHAYSIYHRIGWTGSRSAWMVKTWVELLKIKEEMRKGNLEAN